MKVDFNNLRSKAFNRVTDLTEQLNDAIIKNNDQYAKPNGVYHDQDVNLEGYVLIDAEELESNMNELIQLIGFITCVHKEGDPDFADVSKELPNTLWFNSEDD